MTKLAVDHRALADRSLNSEVLVSELCGIHLLCGWGNCWLGQFQYSDVNLNKSWLHWTEDEMHNAKING